MPKLITIPHTQQHPLRKALNEIYLQDEAIVVEQLLKAAKLPSSILERIAETAKQLVTKVRNARLSQGGLDAFLYQYDLSSNEGIALMCLAEALLRIPDNETVDKLIRDKICHADWEDYLGQSNSLFVNAATWGLMLTGKIMSPVETKASMLNKTIKRLVARGGEPFIRKAISHAMKILGKQFVIGKNINNALSRAKPLEKQGYLFSYDMLGEAACTSEDADRYFEAYQKAIQAVGEETQGKDPISGSGISVKLSALHPRYTLSHYDTVVPILTERLLALAQQAKKVNIGLTVDAEEAERLDLSLDIIANVFSHPSLDDWEGFGLAVQSYQKRAFQLIDWLAELAHQQKKRWMIRLIKGAYWDAEIKNAQVKGLSGYPVFTRKIATDVSFIACAKKILSYQDAFYPAFATHNAYSLSAILEIAGSRRDFEFQCLHGMGYTLYDQIVGENNLNIPCRVYAPVGGHEDLLAYLVRRLLENGANTSFVNRIIDEEISVDDLISDPAAKLSSLAQKAHPQIPLPKDIYGSGRKNAASINLYNFRELEKLSNEMEANKNTKYMAYTTIYNNPELAKGNKRNIFAPANNQQQIGTLVEATAEEIEIALQRADAAANDWEMTSVEQRAVCLEKAADLLEKQLPAFLYLVSQEGGKIIPDALAEVREAIDFCRYYAQQARLHLMQPEEMPGPTGESNHLYLRGRGPMVCISPWNFPLAIFMGQVTAALVAGNPVIAKPAMQTTLIGMATVQLLHEAGIPKNVVQLLPASGKLIGKLVIPDQRIKGVIFTGSTVTAQQINQTLANRSGPIIPLIAETGGQNAMIVDSSALPEQVINDVVTSAFMSAGQRCSALRVLFLQEDIADKVVHMLQGAMTELKLGDPQLLETDIGPVIDNNAKAGLEDHVKRISQEAKLIYRVEMPEITKQGSFFAPCAFEIKSLKQLPEEVFGPVLHIIRFSAKQLDDVIDEINSTGYGLTMGIHSRIDETVQYIQRRIRAGNIYVNRNMIGAVVGVQPFGGEGLSGTGPKAGGPHYLTRLCTERTVTINTTAAGGNATLMSLSDSGT